MARIITLRHQDKPRDSANVSQWTPGGSVATTVERYNHVAGSYTSSNSISTSENINCSRSGNIYTSSSGFVANVNSSNSQDWYSQHFVGPTGISSWSGSSFTGSSLIGSTVANDCGGHWTKNVKGFVCEVAGYPNGVGTSAGDGCGVIQYLRISGVFADSNGRVRVYDMCQGGAKIMGQTWNSQLSNANNTWTKMSYYVSSNDQLSMYHMGWILNIKHKKVCGGGTVNKNMTCRVRYLQPLVTDDGGLYFDQTNKHQILMMNRRWDKRNDNSFYTI